MIELKQTGRVVISTVVRYWTILNTVTITHNKSFWKVHWLYFFQGQIKYTHKDQKDTLVIFMLYFRNYWQFLFKGALLARLQNVYENTFRYWSVRYKYVFLKAFFLIISCNCNVSFLRALSKRFLYIKYLDLVNVKCVQPSYIMQASVLLLYHLYLYRTDSQKKNRIY